MFVWLNKIISSPSKTFLTFCCCFIAGSSLSSLFDFPPAVSVYLYGLLFIAVTAIIFCWHNRWCRFFVSCLLFLVFGIWRYAVTLPDCSAASEMCAYSGKRVTFVGYVSDEPTQKVDSTTYTVAALTMNSIKMSGAVSVKNRIYPSFTYGDVLKIKCSLQKPASNDQGTFHYDKYLARYGMSVICLYPTITKIGEGSGSTALRYIFMFKNYLNNKLVAIWPEPEGSLMAGILYGSKSGLPPYLTNDFSRTGVSHIIAVSGYNVTIIAVVLMGLLIYFGLYRRQAFYAVVAVIILFTIFSGLTASAIRAAVMGIVTLLAKQVGRNARIGNVLVLTVAVMQLGNPYLVLWDVGFQLSFLATLGLVYVSPVLEKFAERLMTRVIPVKTGIHPGSKSELIEKSTMTVSQRFFASLRMTIDFIIEPLTTTLSAIITTFPIILYQFGTFSFIAPLVNVLLLWTIPWIMLAGFVSIISSVIFAPLGQLVAAITHFGLAYVILVVRFFGEQSWASATEPIPIWVMFGMYVVIIWWVTKKRAKTS